MFGEWRKIASGHVVRSEVDRVKFFEFLLVIGGKLEAGTGRTLDNGQPEFLVRFSRQFANDEIAQEWARKMWACEKEAGRAGKPFVDALVDMESVKPEAGQKFFIVVATGYAEALKLQGNSMIQFTDTGKRVPLPHLRKVAPYTYVMAQTPAALSKQIAKALR